MAVPTYVASGTHAVGIGDVSPGLPTGWAENDIFLLQAESFEGSVAAPTGYTLVAEVAKGTADANESFQTWFWKRATASETAPTVTDPGNHALAVVHAFRGCITTGNPWDIQYSGTDSAGTSNVSIIGDTTTVGDTLVVFGVGQHNDTGTYTLSSFANADLATVTVRWDEGTIEGNGGCIGLVTGEKATAGAYGTTTGTADANSGIKTFIVFALKPPAGGTAHTRDINDAISLADARAFTRGLVVADTVSLPDARAFARGITVSDSISLADELAFARTMVIADAISLADELAASLGRSVTIEDTLSLADEVATAKGKGVTINDTISLTDALAFEREITLEDTLVLSDALSFIREVFLTLADTFSLADAQTFGGTAEQGEEQDLTLAPVTKASLLLGQGGSGNLDLGAGSQGSLVLVMEGHRYWRLLIDAIQSSTTRGDIWEIELHETEGGADATTPSLTTTASDGAFSSGNVFDNDTGTFWGPTPAVAAWVQVDVGAGQTIAVAEWTLHHGFADFMPVDVRLQWSDDAVTWHTHDTRTDLVWTPPETQTFTLVAARDPLVKSSLSSSSGTKGTLTLAD